MRIAARPARALLAIACALLQMAAAAPPLPPRGRVPAASMARGVDTPRDYAHACGVCHDNGGFAVKVLADRLGAENALIHKGNRLDPDTIRAVVRNGVGAMPAMSRLEVSDAELDAIITVLGKARLPDEPARR